MVLGLALVVKVELIAVVGLIAKSALYVKAVLLALPTLHVKLSLHAQPMSPAKSPLLSKVTPVVVQVATLAFALEVAQVATLDATVALTVETEGASFREFESLAAVFPKLGT